MDGSCNTSMMVRPLPYALKDSVVLFHNGPKHSYYASLFTPIFLDFVVLLKCILTRKT